ncbi:hypothetical protein GGR01_002863 [Acetobacter oeni]|nr:hypothetical protein [Acetobacter oeni]
MSQTACVAFLFVPLSTAACSTLSRDMNADAPALFSMVRNFLGSLSISGEAAGSSVGYGSLDDAVSSAV